MTERFNDSDVLPDAPLSAESGHPTTRPEITRLCGTCRMGPWVIAQLFGVLADLAWTRVEHYRSDLYHDARWLDRWVHGPADVFYWGADDCGTAIGVDRSAVMTSRKEVWRVRLLASWHPNLLDEADWSVELTRVTA